MFRGSQVGKKYQREALKAQWKDIILREFYLCKVVMEDANIGMISIGSECAWPKKINV